MAISLTSPIGDGCFLEPTLRKLKPSLAMSCFSFLACANALRAWLCPVTLRVIALATPV